MELKYEFLNNSTAGTACWKLAHSNEIPSEIGYRFGKLYGVMCKEHKKLRSEWVKLTKDYAILDGNQDPVLKDGDPTFDTEEKKKFYEAALYELMQTSFQVKILPIPLSSLKEVKLTPMEILALEPILDVDTSV